ncbi:anthranilate synthase component II [Anaerosporobacter faecicola]|uniref:anthranilate synthase component II n=1 Tax=Anaerosporobacter faecicola TaxID=2718714 RepID=UPI00143B6592|nr:aminodeoxychorismate/anthranilate synthase component II [Anaerosporobacter faecicola]
MIVLIDNYDSFSYNLYQLIGTLDSEICVIRNDERTVEEIAHMKPSHIIVSPGPGRPEDAGICRKVIRYFTGKVPILGVCLGHQAICQEFGATISYAEHLMHGKQSEIEVEQSCKIFKDLPKQLLVARYHSLIAVEDTIPEELIILAKTKENEVMAVKHKKFDTYGLQFHPESILTPQGMTMIRNFLDIKS